MPQFVYDDIIKKVVKRERYKLELTDYSTLFNIFKEHSQFQYKDGYKRFVRLVKFSAHVPTIQGFRSYSEGSAYVSPKLISHLKMNIQCLTSVKISNSISTPTVLQKTPYTYLGSTLTAKTPYAVTAVQNTGTGTVLTVQPAVYKETLMEVSPFVNIEPIIPQLFTNPTGKTSDDVLNSAIVPLSNIQFTDTTTVDGLIPAPTIDSDGLAVDYQSANHESDQQNGYDCTSYEFTPVLTIKDMGTTLSNYRTSKTGTTKTMSGRTMSSYFYKEDPTYDTQVLTEIPLRADKIALTMYLEVVRWRNSDLTTTIIDAFNNPDVIWPNNMVCPGKEMQWERLTMDRHSLYDIEYGKLDTTANAYISGAVAENKNDTTTLKLDTIKLKFYVTIEVLLVDMKKK